MFLFSSPILVLEIPKGRYTKGEHDLFIFVLTPKEDEYESTYKRIGLVISSEGSETQTSTVTTEKSTPTSTMTTTPTTTLQTIPSPTTSQKEIPEMTSIPQEPKTDRCLYPP
ncbi:hypothetical protein ACFLQ6_05545 [Thermoproteota archaeon]